MVSKELFVRLNQDRSDKRFEDWSVHRGATHSLIEEAVQKFGKRPEVLIVGSGNCDDLNLQYLFENASLLHFVDIDHQATLDAIQDKVDFSGVSTSWDVFECDITGLISDGTFDHLQDLMRKQDTVSFTQAAKSVVDQIEAIVKPQGILDGYDLVIILPVITQLITPLSTTLPFQSPENENVFLEGITGIAAALATQLLNDSFALTRKGGYFVVVTDILEITHKMNWTSFFDNDNNPKFSNSDQILNCMYDALSNGTILVGALEFLKWADKKKDFFIVQKHWIWVFSANKLYAAVGYLFHNK